MRTCSYKFSVRGYELDSFGHVNNAVYLNYAEAAMWHFFKVNGLMEILKKYELFPVVLESTQRYIHELRLMDEVRIDTEMHCTGGLLIYKHNIINRNTGLISCRVSGKIAYVNRERVICDIPKEIINCLENDTDEDEI